MRQAIAFVGAAALLGVAKASPALEAARNEAEWKEFEKFMKDYQKSYDSEHRKLQRYYVFKSNWQFIQSENAKDQSFTLGVNEWVDQTHEEFIGTHHGYVAAPSLKEMWGGLKHLGTHEWQGEDLPASVDWSTKKAVTPIKNQQQCGSCWAFSTTGSLEGAWAIKTGKLVSLSEQQLVDCSGSFGNQGCSGGLMDNAFKYIEQANMCTEGSYSYTASQGQCKASNCTVGIAKGDVTGYKDVSKDSEKAMMSAVALGPVSVAIEADQSVFQMYKSGVLTANCGTNLDHGVLVVGYGTLNGKDYWKVKNSWGATWGLDGYILLQRGKGQAGECGLLSVPSYPVVKSSTQEMVV